MARLGIPQGSGVSSNDIAYAQEYASTGKIPTGLPKGSFGRVAELARSLPKQEGQLVSNVTGIKPKISDAKIEGLLAMYDVTKKAQQLRELDNNRWGGVVSGLVGLVTGDEDQTKYMNLRKEIIDLLARARTGAALTTSEEKFYSDMLPGRFSEPFFMGADSGQMIDNFIENIGGNLSTKLDGFNTSIYGFSKKNIGGQEYPVGSVITNQGGQKGVVNADGTITIIE